MYITDPNSSRIDKPITQSSNPIDNVGNNIQDVNQTLEETFHPQYQVDTTIKRGESTQGSEATHPGNNPDRALKLDPIRNGDNREGKRPSPVLEAKP